MTLSEIVSKAITQGYYEPELSTRDRSAREMQYGPHHIRHRFKFRGGVKWFQVNVARNNALLERLKRKKI